MIGKILFLTAFLAGLPFLLAKLIYHLHMLQLNAYFNCRYLGWLSRQWAKVFRPVEFFPVALLFVLFLWQVWHGTSHQVVTGTFAFAFAVVSLFLFFTREKGKAKKKLVYTPRVKRLLTAATILFIFIFAVLCQIQASFLAFLFTLALLQALVFLLVLGGNLLMLPVEKGISYYYYRDARRKLQGMPRLKVIGITGSYGKTSTKHIVQKILAQQYNVLMTPASFNTTMGVVRTIREQLSPLHDYFIVEMGAKKPGDIAEICRLVRPTVGMLTSVGPQHLETFKTIERVQETKFELIRALPSDGIAVLNRDEPLINDGMKRFENSTLRYVTYGLGQGEKLPHISARDIRYSEEGTEFTVVREDGQEYPFKTKLLGKHNLYNLLAGIALAFALGMDYKSIYAGVRDIVPIEHRLQIKRKEDYVIIDDAYNANPVGTQMALEVLGLISGNKKILVTPGMIELGSREYELNREFARQAAQVCDYIILVGGKRTKPLQDGLAEAQYPPEKYTVVKDVFAAFEHLEKIRRKGDIILLENDLTDDYDE